jgi:hypothetical protein
VLLSISTSWPLIRFLTVMTFGTFLVACLGIALFFATRAKKR